MTVGTTLVSDAVESAYNRLRALQRDTYNTLSAQFDTAAAGTVGTLALTYDADGVSEGQYLAIDYELLYILSVDGKNVMVIRGFRGTTPATHLVNALVEVKPRFARGLIQMALLEEIRTWNPRLFAVDVKTISATEGVVGYDLALAFPSQISDVLRIWNPGSSDDTALRNNRVPFTTIRKGPSAISTGNKMVVILGWTPPDSRTLHVEYSKPFVLSAFAATTDLVADVGLTASMVDLGWLGAAKRMFTEIDRANYQNAEDPTRTDAVPAGLITSVRRDIDKEYDDRMRLEIDTLLHAYPPA